MLSAMTGCYSKDLLLPTSPRVGLAGLRRREEGGGGIANGLFMLRVEGVQLKCCFSVKLSQRKSS